MTHLPATLSKNADIMMKDHIELGRDGEEAALAFLVAKGYRILQRNWRYGREEIDIIARDGNFVVIIEVKTRSSNALAEPEAAVTKSKQRILVRAANAYMMSRRQQGEVRFDVMSILIREEGTVINHIEDAFYATL